jgi:putative membrane protein
VLEGEPYEGKKVTTTGMAYWDQQLPENSFFCYQLLMFCCAADAKPIGIVVEYDKPKTVEKGGWVKVEGTVGFTTFQGQRFTKITAETVSSTDTPKDPYLFP